MNSIRKDEVIYVAGLVVPLTPKGEADLWSAVRGLFGGGSKETVKFGTLKKGTAKKPTRVDASLTDKVKDLALSTPVRTAYWLADTAEKIEFSLIQSEQVSSICPESSREWLEKFEHTTEKAPEPEPEPKPKANSK